MTRCDAKAFEGLTKRLKAKMSLEDIGKELCPGTKDPRRKAYGWLKDFYPPEYIEENKDWLKIQPHPPRGKVSKKLLTFNAEGFKVGHLKEICQLMSIGGLVDEFTICKDGQIIGIDASRTAVSHLQGYNITVPRDIFIRNVLGLNKLLSKFHDDANIDVGDDSLHIESGKRKANIVLKVPTEPLFKVPVLTDDNFEIIVDNVDPKILHQLSKVCVYTLNYFYVLDNNLMMRMDDVDKKNKTIFRDSIGAVSKCTTDRWIQFTLNISECFQSIKTPARICIYMDGIMQVECKTDRYNIKYYLTPRYGTNDTIYTNDFTPEDEEEENKKMEEVSKAVEEITDEVIKDLTKKEEDFDTNKKITEDIKTLFKSKYPTVKGRFSFEIQYNLHYSYQTSFELETPTETG